MMQAPLKRFLVFTGTAYYPEGGALDLKGSSDTLEECKAWIADPACEEDVNDEYVWVHILDTQTGKIVAYSKGVYGGNAEGSDLLADDAENLRTVAEDPD